MEADILIPLCPQAITEETYEVIQCIREAAIVVKSMKEPPLSLTVHLTSPVVREEAERQAGGGTPGLQRNHLQGQT